VTDSKLRFGCAGCPVLGLIGLLISSNVLGAEIPRTSVQYGEYLARAGDCISCHTAIDKRPYAGGYRLQTPFGFMLGPNITPDPDTGIGKWTADDFYRALHDGINRVGSDMYPTMPYGAYTKVTRADADAIYDYLRTVAPVKSRIDVNHLTFPFNQRWTMAGWRELYFTAGTFVPDPSKSQIWNRGAYLVEGLGHCRDCHSPRNRLGAIDKTKDYQGAAVDGWFALDLSENIATGLGAWSVDDVATFLKTGEFRGKTVAVGPMALVVRNSLSFMTDSDLHAMGVYLKKIPTDSSLRSGQQKPDAGCKSLCRILRRVPPVERPRASRDISAAGGKWRHRGRRSGQHS